MSTFGNGTFKQAIWEEIRWRIDDQQVSSVEAVQQILDVCSYMLCSNEYQDDLREQLREEVRQEILSKLA